MCHIIQNLNSKNNYGRILEINLLIIPLLEQFPNSPKGEFMNIYWNELIMRQNIYLKMSIVQKAKNE